MQSFKDVNGKIWELNINVATVKRVRSLTGVDIINITGNNKEESGENTIFSVLLNDVCLTVDVIYQVLKPQCDSLGITDIQFGELMSGDSICNATDQLFDAIGFFLPEIQKNLYMKILQKIRQEQEKAKQKIKEIAEKI